MESLFNIWVGWILISFIFAGVQWQVCGHWRLWGPDVRGGGGHVCRGHPQVHPHQGWRQALQQHRHQGPLEPRAQRQGQGEIWALLWLRHELLFLCLVDKVSNLILFFILARSAESWLVTASSTGGRTWGRWRTRSTCCPGAPRTRPSSSVSSPTPTTTSGSWPTTQQVNKINREMFGSTNEQ